MMSKRSSSISPGRRLERRVADPFHSQRATSVAENQSSSSEAARTDAPWSGPTDYLLADWALAALGILWEAYNFAADAAHDKWDFAVELKMLARKGVNRSQLRWLLSKGLVEHADEIAQVDQGRRTFRSIVSLSITGSACFVLTRAGVDAADNLLSSSRVEVDGQCLSVSDTPSDSRQQPTPHWDAERHELRLNGHLVKRFKHRSQNQEAILAAFQEEGWPARVDDPLSPVEEADSKRRLNDTVKGLNHHQENRLVRFRGDGTGEAIVWERMATVD